MVNLITFKLLIGSCVAVRMQLQSNETTEAPLVYPVNLAPRGDVHDVYKRKDGADVSVSDPYRFLEDSLSNQT